MDSDIPVPSDVPMPQTAQTVLIVAMTVMAVLSLGYAIYASVRRRDLVHLWLLLGAGLAIPYEALGDNLVHVYYTERGQISWITTFGHSIPAFIGILYFWYLPIYGYLMVRRAHTGVSARRFWLEWSGFLSFAIFSLPTPDPGADAAVYEANVTFDITNPGQPYAAFATNFFDVDDDPGFLFVPPAASQWRHELPNRYLVYHK